MSAGPSDEWGGRFARARVIPPHVQTVRSAQEAHLARPQGLRLCLERVAGPHLQQAPDASEGEPSAAYQLQATLFDRGHQHFFGKTWKSSAQKMKGNDKLNFNEVCYFHTSLCLPAVVLVLELVALSDRPDGSQHALGRGFTILELFASRAEARANDGDRRLNLLHGSPRILLHPQLKGVVEYGSLLKAIDGAHLGCAVTGHPALGSVMHLLPENMLVSAEDDIPGLAASPTGDALLKPQLLKTQRYVLDRLTVSLHPALDRFESRLLQLVNADWHNTKQPGPEGTLRSVVIQERRLHVGVHNGWCFLDKPQVVVLEPQAPGGRGQRGGASKQGALTKDSTASGPPPRVLGLRSSLELQLANHVALALVFQLEYVFSAPVGRESTLSATTTSRAAFMHCVRWGAWCPFRKSSDWDAEETELALLGGPTPNPYGVMVYSAAAAASAPDDSQAGENDDTVSCRLWRDAELRTRSLGASLGAKRQEDPSRQGRPPPASSPPSPGGKHGRRDGATSALESPRGAKLSLSQLAATSRYPAASRSSSALPWQQPFPSQLHPSPLASAHQLSHVLQAGPAASHIAHLEMDLQQDGDALPSAHDGDHLQELPFTPVHAPVITLGRHTPSSRPASSRSALAHLHSAGFPDILDGNGLPADVLDPTEPVHFDPRREEADPLRGDLLVFQFLAFSRTSTAAGGPNWPERVHLTFQFYRFPPVTSQQLRLLPANGAPQRAGDPLPCVLASINKDGAVDSGSPGLQVQFRVDGAFLKPGERRWFLRYLALHSMQVDVWDSDSLLLIGSTAVQLKYLLRQGRPAVQALHEVEVLTTEYTGEDTPLGSGAGLTNVHTVPRGRLHVRTGNIGCPVDLDRGRTAGLPQQSRSHIIAPSDGGSAFRGGSLSAKSVLHLNARNAALAQRLAEVDGDLVALFRNRIKGSVPVAAEAAAGAHSPDLPGEDRQRKLSCLAAVLRREGKEDPEGHVKAPKAMSRREERTQLVRDLHQIKAFQERSKAEGIANMLSQAITTRHALYASLGTAQYMEFVLKNPYNVPQTVTIHSDDPELSVITDMEEWRYFKTLTKTPTPLEENMFRTEEGAPRVYLRPKESVHIPLKYQMFFCERTAALQGPSLLATGRSDEVAKKPPSNLAPAKSVKVTFQGEDGKPLAICQVDVEPTPHVVDQSFRLYHPELCFLKKAIRMPPWDSEAAGIQDGSAEVSVCCSDPNVICQTKMLAAGEPQDVYLKVPGCASPQLKMFYIMVFTDKWLAAPTHIWQIYVHFLERVDVSCVTGQRSCQSLVLRGTQAVRKVKCFSSHPRELQVDPAGVFALPPAAVQELQLQVQPWQAGGRFLFVSAVDVEQRRLVAAWLLFLSAHRPVLSKAFEVCVPVGGGHGSTRRITYTNPYTGGRHFLLRSDRPDLLQFKEERFQIGGGESYTIGLRFAPSQSPGTAEILVYVNDPQEKTEETFCVKVNYS